MRKKPEQYERLGMLFRLLSDCAGEKMGYTGILGKNFVTGLLYDLAG